MDTTRLEKKLLRYTKELSDESIKELIDFTKQLCENEYDSKKGHFKTQLNDLSKGQMNHVEEEFADYKTRYPVE
jgi:hypothetical protein